MDDTAIAILLGILGIAITIFTVIYSFMEGAKQRVKDLDIAIQLSTGPDPRKEAEYQFTKSYLQRLRSMNQWVLGLIIGDLLTFILFIVHILKEENNILLYATFVVLSLYLTFCIVVFAIYILRYRQRFRRL